MTFRENEEETIIPPWKDFDENPQKIIKMFQDAHSGPEPKNFKAMFTDPFQIKLTPRGPEKGEESLTVAAPPYTKSWKKTVDEMEISKNKVVVVTSDKGTIMVVPNGGKFKDMFTYMKDKTVPDDEKVLFLKKIRDEAKKKGGTPLVWTDGSQIAWLHVRITDGGQTGGASPSAIIGLGVVALAALFGSAA